MTRARRNLLICEVLACFSPAAFALIVFILSALNGARPATLSLGDALVFVWLASGVAGLVGVVNVLRWLIQGSAFLRPRMSALVLILGTAAAAVLPVGLAADSAMKLDGRLILLALFFVLPVASAAHLAYLARGYLRGRDMKSPDFAALRTAVFPDDSAARGRRLWKVVIKATAIASLIMNLVPRYGPPQFVLARLSSDSMVWSFGWPLEVFVYDPSSGQYYWGLGALVTLPAQLLVLGVLLIVAFWPARLEPMASVGGGAPQPWA